MRQFAIIFDKHAARQLTRIKARGPIPAFDAALATAFRFLQACPEMAPPAFLGERWSSTIRKLGVGDTGYDLYCRVNLRAEVVFVRAIRHQNQRPLKRL